jgi:hypothetical protein
VALSIRTLTAPVCPAGARHLEELTLRIPARHDLSQPLPVRYARVIGTQAYLRQYWPGCQDSRNHDATGQHLGTHDVPFDFAPFPDAAQIAESDWAAMQCARCGQAAPPDANRQVFTEHLWDTSSGLLEPGCLYHPVWFEDEHWPHIRNPDGTLHLHAVLGCGCTWDIDAQASNCTRPGDRSHKCWVRHGDPMDPQGSVPFHVDKQGETCAAGAGSIICSCGAYHGFLHHGQLTPNL